MMMRSLIISLWLVSVGAVPVDVVVGIGSDSTDLGFHTTKDDKKTEIHGGGAHHLEYDEHGRRLQDSPYGPAPETVDLSYKEEIDVFDDSPVVFNESMPCTPSSSTKDFPDRWDMYRLNLQANHCYTIRVNAIDCNMMPSIALYKGVATQGKSPVPTFPYAPRYQPDSAFYGGALIGPTYVSHDRSYAGDEHDTKYCPGAGFNPEYKMAPSAEDGSYTLAVFYDWSYSDDEPCVDGSFEYEVEVVPEECAVGQVTYEQGEIDHRDSLTIINASVPCVGSTDIGSIPEFWQLWRLNLPPDNCYTLTLRSVDCGLWPDFAVFQGIATAATPGSRYSDPDALIGATLVDSERDSTEAKYCDGRDRLQDFKNVRAVAPPDGLFTLAIFHSGSIYWQGGCEGSARYELEIQSRPCVGLRDTCTSDAVCASGFCTGRPGKAKKCRFCARKNEICETNKDCCQSQKFPGRYCEDGQCKKRTFPIMLASVDYHGFWSIDTETAIGSERVSDEDVDWDVRPGRSMVEIEYDPATRILYGMTSGQELQKIDPLSGALIETLSDGNSGSGSLEGMEFVDGILYGANRGSNGLLTMYTVDTTTGLYTKLGDVTGSEGSRSVSGLAYDGTNFFAVITNQISGYFSDLIRIDLNKLQVTSRVAVTDSDSGERLNWIGSLEFGPDGILYATFDRSSDAYSGDGRLIRINKDTGVATSVGNIGFIGKIGYGGSIGGLAFAEA